jgi:drug/metabolite transporter (DMT)-like permease
MDVGKILLLALYALGMASGQILFKLAANDVALRGGLIPGLLTSRVFWLAVALYGVLTVLWVWLLMRIPLVYAYPFMTLAFVFTPLLASLILGEGVGGAYLVGSALLLAGLLIITWTAPTGP